jgi:hypothetical protein
MNTMASASRTEFDAAAVTLLAPSGGKTDSGTDRDVNVAVPVTRLDQAFWQDGRPELALGLLQVNVHITEISDTGSEFVFALEGAASDDFAGGITTLVSMKIESFMGSGLYRFAIDGQSVLRMCPDVTHLALSTDKSVDSPSVTYRAWLSFAKAS